MTLNSVMALILRYFTEFDIASQADCLRVVEDIPVMFAEYRLPLLAKTDPPYSAVSLR